MADLSIGGISLGFELFSACKEGFSVVMAARATGQTATNLRLKLWIEENQLHAWGKSLDADKGELDRRLEELEIKELVVAILAEISVQLVDVQKLTDRYGMKIEGLKDSLLVNKDPSTLPSVPSLYEAILSGKNNDAATRLRAFSKQIHHALQTTRKLRFAISDCAKFNSLINDLEFFNKQLRRLLPQQRRLDVALSTTTLATGNPTELQTIEEATRGTHNEISTIAQIKRYTRSLEDQLQKRIIQRNEYDQAQKAVGFLSAKTLRHDAKYLQADSSQKLLARFIAKYGRTEGPSSAVLVEQKEYSVKLDHDTQVDRIHDIARYLHASSITKSPELLVPDCVGYVDDVKENRFYLLYSLHTPETTIKSLKELICESRDSCLNIPALESRFALALALAMSLFNLHLTTWLHKSIRSANVIFYLSTVNTTPKIESPIMFGFDYSRPNDPEQVSDAAAVSNREDDLYRHPDCQGEISERFQPLYDVYSLGVVLMEIGFWKVTTELLGDEYESMDSEMVRTLLLEIVESRLPGITGSRYALAVKKCLCAEETEIEVLQEVVLELDLCRA